jgi:hypothetical protein
MVNQTGLTLIVASTGRPIELQQLLENVQRQSLQPDRIILSLHSQADAPAEVPDGVHVIFGPKGLPAQRNRGMESALGASEFLAFVDDDYLPTRDMIQGALAVFRAYPDVVGCNGRLLADGINSKGITYDDARDIIAQHERHGRDVVNICDVLDGLYGCNMVFRASAIGDVRFDENLPLYGWQEDIDFAAQLLPRGRLIRTDAFAGVHRGAKGGRSSGVKLGYAQVVNPIYLARKRTMRWAYAIKIIRNNIAANAAKMFFPEAWVDRRGRLLGNLRGLADVVARKDNPKNILRME